MLHRCNSKKIIQDVANKSNINCVKSDNFIDEQTIPNQVTIYQCPIYYNLLNNIRNLKSLTDDEIEYLNKLPKINLLEIINIYNIHIQNIHKYIT